VRVDESIVNTAGGTEVKGPKTRASIHRLGLDRITLQGLQTLHAKNLEDARLSEIALAPRAFVFSTGEDPALPPHPDSMSHAFSRARELAGVADDVHLHSLRHFQATALDALISEAQKQARLGWATVHMARHYTDAIGEEDRRAAEHIGLLLDAGAAPPSSAATASTSG
jgi:integrase